MGMIKEQFLDRFEKKKINCSDCLDSGVVMLEIQRDGFKPLMRCSCKAGDDLESSNLYLGLPQFDRKKVKHHRIIPVNHNHFRPKPSKDAGPRGYLNTLLDRWRAAIQKSKEFFNQNYDEVFEDESHNGIY